MNWGNDPILEIPKIELLSPCGIKSSELPHCDTSVTWQSDGLTRINKSQKAQTLFDARLHASESRKAKSEKPVCATSSDLTNRGRSAPRPEMEVPMFVSRKLAVVFL